MIAETNAGTMNHMPNCAPYNILHPHTACEQHRNEQCQHQRHFVADQLRDDAERAEQRILVVARPARHHDRQRANGANGDEVENARCRGQRQCAAG